MAIKTNHKLSKKADKSKSLDRFDIIKRDLSSFLNHIEEELTKSGVEFGRLDWQKNSSSNPPNGYNEGIDIKMTDQAGNIYSTHFYL